MLRCVEKFSSVLATTNPFRIALKGPLHCSLVITVTVTTVPSTFT
ncbi:hypothetical protein L195_g064684, partial [Trifolium pratense]